MKRQTAIIWVWGLVLIAGAVGGGYAWWRQQDLTQAYEAGRAAADADRWEEALALAQPYADRDDPRINGLLADAYINGPDSIQDIDKGLTLRRRAAEAGDMRAAYFLGKWILENEPTDAQAQEAIGYIQEAANCGMPLANYELGLEYAKGERVPLDYVHALQLLEAAAFAGVTEAYIEAGIVNAQEISKSGRDIDYAAKIKTSYWIFIAARSGNEEASKILEGTRTAMREQKGDEYAASQISILEREASLWAKKISPQARLKCLH